MPKKRDPSLFLNDILGAIENINGYTKGMNYENFLQDKKTQDAVIRNFEIIGEASKNIPEDIKKLHPDVDWREAARMRDKLSHEYFGVSHKVVWSTIKEELPVFQNQVEKVVEDLEEGK